MQIYENCLLIKHWQMLTISSEVNLKDYMNKERKNRFNVFNRLNRKILGGGVLFLSSISLFAVGFSSWVVVSGDKQYAIINLNADQYTYVDVPVDCILDAKIKSITFYSGSGFLTDNNKYTNSATINGNFNFSVTSSKTCIQSLRNNKSFSLLLKISTSLSDFVFSNFDMNGFSNQTLTSYNDSNSTVSLYNIVLSNDEYNCDLIENITFSINISFSGATFPTLTSNSFIVTILAGEFYNEA